MGKRKFRIHKKIAPGTRLTVSKKGITTSFGPKGRKLRIGSQGAKVAKTTKSKGCLGLFSVVGAAVIFTVLLHLLLFHIAQSCRYTGRDHPV